MIITQATLQGLRTTVDFRFSTAYAEAETFHEKVSSRIDIKTATGTYAWINEVQVIREWIGPRVKQALTERAYVLHTRKWESTIEIPRSAVADDNLGLYLQVIVPGFGTAVKQHPDALLVEAVQANPIGFDGKAFFATDHPTYAPEGKAQSYSNDLTIEVPLIDANGDLITDAEDWLEELQTQSIETSEAIIRSALARGLNRVRRLMGTRIGENGNPLLVTGNTVLSPQLHQKPLLEITQGTKAVTVHKEGITTIDNVMGGMFNLVTTPRLEAAPDEIYVFDTTKPIMPYIRQVRSNPVLKGPEQVGEVDAFNNDVWVWGIDGDDGAAYRESFGVSLPFLATRINLVPGTPPAT